MAGKSAMRGKTEAVPRSTKATKRLSVDELVAFMSLPIFYELRTAVDVGILLFDDLDEYDLPEGYSKEDIWRILLAVRKQAAVFVPEDPERTADMWMVTTSSLSFNTEMLEVRSKEDSSLARSLRDMQGSPFVTRFIERTLMRGLADEGIAMEMCIRDRHESVSASEARGARQAGCRRQEGREGVRAACQQGPS